MTKRQDENRKFFKRTFDALAINGCIGAQSGQLAYAYIRVSSDKQADEDRDGLPRQIGHCHEIATTRGYRIPFDMVFADDASGFEFEDRPELARLRDEYKNGKRAYALVMEHIDRLSRNADWHQGYLLAEMKKYGIEAIFWKEFSSRVERAVMGAVSQDGMELAQARMTQGIFNKAKERKRITAQTPAYGLMFVDSQGRQGETARRDTCYAHHEPKTSIVRMIYEKVGIEGVALRKLASDLDELCPPPTNCRHWGTTTISNIIKNPVYKGEFVANRWYKIKVPQLSPDGLTTRFVTRMLQRPRDEWIVINDPKVVPPIVSPELWDAANRMLEKNRQMSRRNAQVPYLLTGLIKCTCGRNYVGQPIDHRRKNGESTRTYRYKCGSRLLTKVLRDEIGCKQSVISCRILDQAVWAVVLSALLDPDLLIQALDQLFANDANAELLRQIEHLQEKIESKAVDDEKNRRAYMADAFDEHEFAALRRQSKEEIQILKTDIDKLQNRVLTPAQAEAERESILALAQQARQVGDLTDAPFNVRQRIIKQMVNHIELDLHNGIFKLSGAIRGTYSLGDIAFTSTWRLA